MQQIVTSPEQFLRTNGPLMRLWQEQGFSVNALREHQIKTNASLLRYDQWKDIDTSVAQAARLRLSAAADLLALPQRRVGLWQAISQFQTGSFMDPAEITMDPRSLVDRDRIAYDTHIVPIPFISKEFSLTIRELGMPGNGESVETANAQAASRVVNEKIEDMVINGASNIVVNGAQLYGYRTHPNRIIGTLSQAWNTPDNIFKSVAEIITVLHEKQYRDNIVLYMHVDQFLLMMQKEGVDQMSTTLDRITRSFAVFGLRDIKVSDSMPVNQFIAVSLTTETVDMVVAQALRTLQWDERGGMVTNFLVLTAMAPRIKPIMGTDGVAQTGIAHFTAP